MTFIELKELKDNKFPSYREESQPEEYSQIGIMDRTEFDNIRRIGSIKSAANMYGERIRGEKPELEKFQIDFSEDPSSRTRELHLARRDITRLNESKKAAESVKFNAESELLSAKKVVKDLTSLIEESKSKARAQKRELKAIKKPEGSEDGSTMPDGRVNDFQYEEVKRELEFVKQELNKLKLDMASVLEEKSQANKEIEASSSKMVSYSSSVEGLNKKIEEVNEEHVLVELARIEAVKDLGAIEAQREAEAIQFSSKMEKTKRRINEAIQEIDKSKEIEMKLAATTDDVNVLRNELSLVKAMEKKKVRGNNSSDQGETSKRREDELETSSLLLSVTEELEAAKKELASISEETFQFMASMDIIRDELKHVTEETTRLKKTEMKSDITIKNLNSKLLRAKSKLEFVALAEEKAKGITSSLSLTLPQLKTEAEAAKKEKELISGEAASIHEEIQKTESEIDLAEERFQAALQELEAVKSSEAIALESLKALSEKTMQARASASRHNSSITISDFEYEYLKGRAEGAVEIADKKVAASQAWIEAIKASEKEILMKIEIAHREIRELRVEEEQDRPMAKKEVENTEDANIQLDLALPRKLVGQNSVSTPTRQAKPRRPSSPGIRLVTRSSSITLKKQKMGVPNLVKFFSSKKIQKD